GLLRSRLRHSYPLMCKGKSLDITLVSANKSRHQPHSEILQTVAPASAQFLPACESARVRLKLFCDAARPPDDYGFRSCCLSRKNFRRGQQSAGSFSPARERKTRHAAQSHALLAVRRR